jgi:long-chain fatty acid transport protein
MKHTKKLLAALITGTMASSSVLATNGYAPHGWGTKAKAMGGVATALPQDTIVGATNPAGMAFLGDRMDLGVAAFSPSDRGYQANDDFDVNEMGFPTGPFITPGKYKSDNDWFFVPSFGYNRELDNGHAIGIVIYGNGGMNTEYNERPVFENFAAAPDQLAVPDPSFAPEGTFASPTGLLFTFDASGNVVPVTDSTATPAEGNANPGGVLTATTPTGVNLEQLFIQFPYTFKFADNTQSIGIAPILAAQSFEAKGLQPFIAASVNPDSVTNNGKEWSYGLGLQVGWYGEVTDKLSAGISYRTKTHMSKFDDYAGLFANGGEFDIPPMFNVGIAYKVRPNVTLGADYQHIGYNEIDAISNSNDKDLSPCFTADPKPEFCLGGKDGIGFGWDSMDILKLGVKWDYNPKWTFLGGFSWASDFTTDRQALFNILAPATIKYHITAGASYRPNDKNEFNLALAYMPNENLKGTSPSITQTQTGEIFMEQKEIELQWSRHF